MGSFRASNANAPAGGTGQGYSAPQSGGVTSWFWSAEEAVEDEYRKAMSTVAKEMYAAEHEVEHLLNVIEASATWADIRAAVTPILGQYSFKFGISVGILESIGDLVKGLFELQKMLVLAALYEEITGVRSHPGKTLSLELASGALLPVNALMMGVMSMGPPSWFEAAKTADDEVRAILLEIEQFLRHPIDTVTNFASKKWAGRYSTWKDIVDWWNKAQALYSSGAPGKMYEAGIMMGKVVGEIILTVVAVVSAVGAAVRAVQAVGLGARVLLGLVTVEAVDAELASARLAVEAAQAARLQAAGNAGKLSEAMRAEAAANARIQAAQAQRAMLDLEAKFPRLMNKTGTVEELPPAKGVPAGGAPDADEVVGKKPASRSAVNNAAEARAAANQKLSEQVANEAKQMIAAGGKNGPAYSRAAAFDQVSPGFTNIPVNKVTKFPGVEPMPGGQTLQITDPDAFMQGVEASYRDAGQTLNPTTRQQIADYISSNDTFQVKDGVPGLHSEVQATNWIYNNVGGASASDVNVATYKLTSPYPGQAFPACSNCQGIMGDVNEITAGGAQK